jgi:hypothetical protein
MTWEDRRGSHDLLEELRAYAQWFHHQDQTRRSTKCP